MGVGVWGQGPGGSFEGVFVSVSLSVLVSVSVPVRVPVPVSVSMSVFASVCGHACGRGVMFVSAIKRTHTYVCCDTQISNASKCVRETYT